MQTVALHPWLLIPGVFVIVGVLAFNFVGDGLRDAADPYQMKRPAQGEPAVVFPRLAV